MALLPIHFFLLHKANASARIASGKADAGSGAFKDDIGTVALGTHGEIFGSTVAGGAWHSGTIFEFLPPDRPGDIWKEVLLHSFTGKADGAKPVMVPYPVLAAGNTIYGIGSRGGALDGGAVFKLTF